MIGRAKFTAFLPVVLILSQCASRQPEVASPLSEGADAGPARMEAGDRGEGNDYVALLKRVKEQDPSVDFTALRLAYTRTSDYDPLAVGEHTLKDTMNAAADMGDYREAVNAAEQILDNDFVDIEAHVICDLAYGQLGDEEKKNFHHYVASGLIKSIFDSGDGRSPETAYVVIAVKEEYEILNIMGLVSQMQLLIKEGEHSIDVLHAFDPQSHQNVDVYFNVDIPFASYGKSF